MAFFAAWGSLTRFVRGIDRVENEEERDKLESVYQLLSPLLDVWEQQYDTLYEELGQIIVSSNRGEVMKISRKFKINDTTELTFTTVLSSSELSDAYYEKRG